MAATGTTPRNPRRRDENARASRKRLKNDVRFHVPPLADLRVALGSRFDARRARTRRPAHMITQPPSFSAAFFLFASFWALSSAWNFW